MPILFMALIALAVFLGIGIMMFYAAYAEAHTPRDKENAPPSSAKSLVQR